MLNIFLFINVNFSAKKDVSVKIIFVMKSAKYVQCDSKLQYLLFNESPVYKAGKNAKFPWNMVKNCAKNVNYFRNVRICCKKKTEIYI